MKNIIAIFAVVFSGCSLAEPDRKNCDACVADAGTDTVSSDAKPEAKPDTLAPDTKKPDVPSTCTDNDKDGYCSDVDCYDDDPNLHPNAPEVCNGKDDNCDGKIDNNLTDVGASCGSAVGECEPGKSVCLNGKLECAGAISAQNELCDGKDNDCDGKTDEDYPDLGNICDEGVGECKKSGHLVCNGSATILKCDAKPLSPKIEGGPGDATCTDNLDNDCDGLMDLDDPDCKNCSTDANCDQGNKCELSKCLNGVCQHKALADGVSCSDGKFCNGSETCQSGKCEPGAKPACDDGSQCTVDTCDEVKHCVNTLITTSAKEGLPGSPECLDGKDNDCDGLTDLSDPDCLGCANDLECVDTNPCTNDVCNSQKICVNSPKTNGASCDDGLYCNGAETCQSGKCEPGTAVVCQNTNACFTVKCDEAKQGACTATSVDGCKSCTSETDCDDKNSCTADACISGKCYNTKQADNTYCDDGAFCTVSDKCQSGQCMGTPRDCSPFADSCNTATCDDATDTCVKQPKANNTPCDDGLYCNGSETCQSGKCSAGTAIVCTSSDLCKIGVCNESLDQCSFNPNPIPGTEGWNIVGSCSDGKDNDCDGLYDYADPDCKQCNQASDCGTSSACVQYVCNSSWKCETKYTTGLCDDGSWCTVNDYCSSGTCLSGGARNCDDGNYSTTDSCNESQDICEHKQCTQNSECNDGNQCTLDTCDTTTWTCKHSDWNGASCDDGLYCTIGEYCTNGYCTNGQPRNCSPGTCNENTNTCDGGGNGPGCADGTREGFLDGAVFPNIAGCSGTWSSPGLSNGSYLCASGWHICTGASDVSSRLPYGKTCSDAWSGSEKRFFATFQPSGGNGYCNTTGTNDVFGCGNYGDPPAIGSCGVLNVFSSEDCNAIKYPYSGAPETWKCGGTGDSSNELITIVKLQAIGGGVLCCSN